MPVRLHRRARSRQALAALLALCCLLLSTVASFQHTHDLAGEASLVSTVAFTPAARNADAASHHATVCKAARPKCSHCVACEWQAVNVSPALPAFTFAVTPPPIQRSVTTFPRCLRLTAIRAASRAPPLA